MKVSYDPHKRAQTLAERGLDFDDAVHVFAGRTIDSSTTAETMASRAG